MEELGVQEKVKIIDWDDEVQNNPLYQKMYAHVTELYHQNPSFTEAVDATTLAVLKNAERDLNNLTEATKVATHYLLSELAFLEFAPEFLQSKHVAYVYHKNWPVYERYIAGTFDGQPKLHLDFILLEHPLETYRSIDTEIGAEQTDEPALERIQRTKVIRASYDDYPPAFMTDAETQRHSGIFYEVLYQIAMEEHWDIRFLEETGYGVISQGLAEKRFDIFASTVWPTEERKAVSGFSDALYVSDVYMWCRAEEDIDTVQKKLEDPAFRISVKEHDISDSITIEHYPHARRIYIPQLADSFAVLQFVAEEKADATFAEAYLVEQFFLQSGVRLQRMSDTPIKRFGNCFMMAKEDSGLRNLVNSYIQKYKKTGFIEQLIKKYTKDPTTFSLQ
jgi:ABC-type amino acid transport substrate-binding protein